MTPADLEVVLRETAARVFDLPVERVPFVWPRGDQAAEGADAASALAPRMVGLLGDRLPEGTDRPPRRVAGRIVDGLAELRDRGRFPCAGLRADDRGFVNLTLGAHQREELLRAAADGPRFLTGRAWDGAGEWPRTGLHEAGPVAQARRWARADARARVALAVGGQAPPPGPHGEVSWRDPYLDGGRDGLFTPAAKALGAIGEDNARIAFCRSVPERPRETETTGRDLPVLPSAEYPGAWARLTDANPAFRLRYAHAHALSRVRWVGEGGPRHEACERHTAPVRRSLVDGPSALDGAARREEPHILVRYLETLAGAYDEWRTCPSAATAPAEHTTADPTLPSAVAGILRTGLFLLGVSAPTRL
ncbi:DALR anticodon-binding domain-containing protein [Nocardiopsis sp. N85]|uniref:DALR anticodon-binding domain-containing protein n=1 Tax=Nocardiopsis sp. N85 TaxID=3029400 RepID=UPI00237F9811|nr:DALR anticodon-binding domain-containing protein [Nocardiopsis sp. N85]MDE3724772.1 DALR anticodon-binding domain-containing protein [Nocardiopsis sp. N85]